MRKSVNNERPFGHCPLTDGHAHLNKKVLPVLLDRMDELGIDMTVVVASGIIDPYELAHRIIYGLDLDDIDVFKANEYVIEASCIHPKLLPFFFVNPFHAPTTAVLEQISHCCGLKIAPAVHGIGFMDPRIKEYILIAMEYNMPVYSHCLSFPSCSVEAFVDLARSFPEVSFILGHGGRGNLDLCAIDLIRLNENICMETSGSFDYVIHEAVKNLGADRVIFGSEFPLQHQIVELTKISRLLSAVEFERVANDNIFRLIGKEYALVP
ncbi:MAG: amidohydrolase family protein [Ignavibacteriales bacterium]